MSRALALVDSSDESRKHQGPGAAPRLLETKFYVPRARFDVIPRLRLIDEIRRGADQYAAATLIKLEGECIRALQSIKRGLALLDERIPRDQAYGEHADNGYVPDDEPAHAPL